VCMGCCLGGFWFGAFQAMVLRLFSLQAMVLRLFSLGFDHSRALLNGGHQCDG